MARPLDADAQTRLWKAGDTLVLSGKAERVGKC